MRWNNSMQAVAVAIAKATWAWVKGKSEEAMGEVLGAGRGVQAGEVETPAYKLPDELGESCALAFSLYKT